MAQTDAELGPVAPTERRKWPLAIVVWIDLVITAVLIVASVLVVELALLAFKGVSVAELQAMSDTERLGLIGIRGAFVSTLLQNLIWVVVPLIRIAWVRREPIASIGFTVGNWPLTVGVGFVVGCLAIGTNIVVGLLLQRFSVDQSDQSQQFAALLQPGDVLGQTLFVALTVLVAPFGEETLFRGYLFNAIRQNTGRIGLVAAYIVSAGVFASIHLLNVTQGQFALVVPIFIVGLLLAAAMHVTRSLLAGVIAHAMFNSLGTLALLFCVNTNFPVCPV